MSVTNVDTSCIRRIIAELPDCPWELAFVTQKPISAIAATNYFKQVASPPRVLALLDRIDELEGLLKKKAEQERANG